MPATERMTAEEYLAKPFPSEWPPTELVEGEEIVQEPLLPHQLLKNELTVALTLWARGGPGRGLVTPPLDVLVDPLNVFAPDLLWYRENATPSLSAVRPYPLPDLAAEIRSPSTWRYDIGPKKAAYERAGLRELLLVDTAAREVLVFRRSSPGAMRFDVVLELERSSSLTSPLLPGFELALSELFAAIE